MTDAEAQKLRDAGHVIHDPLSYYILLDAAGAAAVMRNTSVAYRRHLDELKGRFSSIQGLSHIVTEKSATTPTAASEIEDVLAHVAATTYNEHLKRAAAEFIELIDSPEVQGLYEAVNPMKRHQPIGLISARPADGKSFEFLDVPPEKIQLFI
jgi:hypothetical protein